MITKIPWWTKIGAKLLLSRLPFGYSIWQRFGLFRHGSMDTSVYALDVFDVHMQKTGLTGQLQGKTILELGPGDSIATAIIAAAHGAKAILVDAGSFVRTDIDPYINLAKLLDNNNLHSPDLSDCRNIDEILVRCHAQYLKNGLKSIREIENESIDLIFSQAVLEHIRAGDFLETIVECRRVLKPGGICSHQIDLRDHIGGALNNLRFSDRIWESEFFARSGFYTNRIRYSRMLDLFKQAGFQAETTIVSKWANLPTPQHKMTGEFRTLTDDDLMVSVFDAILRKS